MREKLERNQDILKLYDEGHPIQDIADLYKLGRAATYNIINRELLRRSRGPLEKEPWKTRDYTKRNKPEGDK